MTKITYLAALLSAVTLMSSTVYAQETPSVSPGYHKDDPGFANAKNDKPPSNVGTDSTSGATAPAGASGVYGTSSGDSSTYGSTAKTGNNGDVSH